MKVTKNKKLLNKEKSDSDYDSETELEININNDIELDKVSKSEYLEHFYNIIYWAGSFILRSSIILFKVSGIYLAWICLHYGSSHLYVKLCVPNTIIGFMMSPFMIATPHCQGLRWIVYNAANVINNMWLLIGAWAYSLIWNFNNNKTDHNGM